jgi:hypothetical protein
LDVPTVTEFGLYVSAQVPSTVTGTALTKSAVNGTINDASVSSFGGTRILAIGVQGASGTAGTNTQGDLVGVYGTAQVNSGTDATAAALQANIVNAGGTAVTAVQSALSKYGLLVGSSGAAANTAFIYCSKSGGPPGTTPQNCAHGILIDGASITAGNSAMGVVTGTTPTVLWNRDSTGKRNVSVTAPGAGGGPFAGGSAAHITISLTGLTTAAQALSASITVNTTAVTASSRIVAQVISYAYGAAGAMAAGWPAVSLGAIVAGTSFAFQIANLGTGALSGAIGISFTIEN